MAAEDEFGSICAAMLGALTTGITSLCD